MHCILCHAPAPTTAQPHYCSKLFTATDTHHSTDAPSKTSCDTAGYACYTLKAAPSAAAASRCVVSRTIRHERGLGTPDTRGTAPAEPPNSGVTWISLQAAENQMSETVYSAALFLPASRVRLTRHWRGAAECTRGPPSPCPRWSGCRCSRTPALRACGHWERFGLRACRLPPCRPRPLCHRLRSLSDSPDLFGTYTNAHEL